MVALALAAALLCGCTAQARLAKAQYEALMTRLPGRYDNAAQLAEDGPGSGRLALTLLVLPAHALAIGDDVYYVRESASGDPRRVLSLQLWSFSQDAQHRIVQASYVFKEPRRWLEPGEEADLLRSVVPEDLLPLAGCELLWSALAPGYQAEPAAGACQPGAAAAGLLIARELELGADTLEIVQSPVGADGQVGAAPADASAARYRFARQAAAR